jgi:hypothetical protein
MHASGQKQPRKKMLDQFAHGYPERLPSFSGTPKFYRQEGKTLTGSNKAFQKSGGNEKQQPGY